MLQFCVKEIRSKFQEMDDNRGVKGSKKKMFFDCVETSVEGENAENIKRPRLEAGECKARSRSLQSDEKRTEVRRNDKERKWKARNKRKVERKKSNDDTEKAFIGQNPEDTKRPRLGAGERKARSRALQSDEKKDEIRRKDKERKRKAINKRKVERKENNDDTEKPFTGESLDITARCCREESFFDTESSFSEHNFIMEESFQCNESSCIGETFSMGKVLYEQNNDCGGKKCDHERLENIDNIINRVVRMDLYNDVYQKPINDVFFQYCESCFRILFSFQFYKLKRSNEMSQQLCISENDILCYSCKFKINKGQIPPRSARNNLSLDEIPRVLKELNFLEKRFICQIQTYMTMIKLKSGGQYAQEGFAIHFPCNPSEFVALLPRKFDDVGIICISGNYEGVIRENVIFEALEWLKAHNKFYHIVDIDGSSLTKSKQTIMDTDFIGSIDTDTIDVPEIGTVAVDYQATNIINESLNDDKIIFPICSRYPVSFFDTKNSEVLVFPWLFPKGKNDFDIERCVKLTLLEYLQSRFLHKDNRFRCDIPYLIVSVNQYENSRLRKLVTIYVNQLKKSNIVNSVGEMVHVTAGDLKNFSFENNLYKNSLMFLKNIRGTPSYWKNELLNLLARFRTLGAPDIFATFTIDECGWPEMTAILKHDLEDKFVNVQNAIRKDPVLVAIYANRRFEALLKFIKDEKVLGKVTDYYVRVEFQGRGSVHFHVFFWLEDAPALHKNSSHADIIRYIDKIISTEIPDCESKPELHDLVKRKQIHRHTGLCAPKSKKRNVCKFSFPRNLCDVTRILYYCERARNGISFYQTKRSHGAENVNPYNPKILLHWCANMDIQLVNGTNGLAYYVSKYATKAEPEELKQELLKTMREIEDRGQLTLHGRMLRLGMCMLKTRRMSAQEAAFRICHLPFIHSSRGVEYISAQKPNKRYKKLRDQSIIQNLPNESIKVFVENNLDLYRKRPVELENLAYYEFVAWYTKSQESAKNSLMCIDGETFVRRRKKFIVVRTTYHSPHTDDFYYALLLETLPHRREEELLDDDEEAKVTFLRKEHLLRKPDFDRTDFVNKIIEASQRLRTVVALQLSDENQSDSDINDDEVENFEHYFFNMEYNNSNDFSETDKCIGSDLCNENLMEQVNEETQWQNLRQGNIILQTLSQRILDLNSDQKRVMRYLHYKLFCSKEKFLLYIGGNAGTGKSYLLSTVIEWLNMNLFDYAGQNCVLVCAPTGIAAKNIKGVTLHSALKLPIQHGFDSVYRKLSERSLMDLRDKLKDRKVLIIDEVSMVSEHLLICINKRLQEIKNDDLLFGGMHVIITGDFLQLRPVMGKPSYGCDEIFDSFDILWLSQNMRQKEQYEWCQLLDRARLGNLSLKDVEILQSRCFDKNELDNVSVDLRMYPKKHMVDIYNCQKQSSINPSYLSIFSIDLYSPNDVDMGCLVSDQNIPSDDREAAGLVKELKISTGSKVMLVRNIGDGLVNGSLGYVHDIIFDDRTGKVLIIYVKFDDHNSGLLLQDPNKEFAIPIEKVESEYIYKGRFIVRKQFPLIPAWAVTIHKAQGLTLNSAVVNISECFSAGQAYVGLSRVSDINNLYIENGPNQKQISYGKIFADKSALTKLLNFKSRAKLLRKSESLKKYNPRF